MAEQISTQMTGGMSQQSMPATPEIQQIVDEVKDALLSKMKLNSFTFFEAVCYTQQVVAGMNYFVKIKIEEDKYIHARIWKHFGNEPVELSGHEDMKSENDPITYVEAY